jgi:hypothetical protein
MIKSTTSFCLSLPVILILILTVFHSPGQSKLENFKGELYFKDSRYFVSINREINDTTITYLKYVIGDSLYVTKYAIISSDNEFELKYLPVKYELLNDTIFLKCINPLSKQNEIRSVYSLNPKSPIECEACLWRLADSCHENGSIHFEENGKYNFYVEDCDEYDNLSLSFTGDTTIKLKDFQMNCYIFEGTHKYHRSVFKRRVLFEKKMMVPVDITDYYYFNEISRRFRDAEIKKWLLSRHLKLILVEPE